MCVVQAMGVFPASGGHCGSYADGNCRTALNGTGGHVDAHAQPACGERMCHIRGAGNGNSGMHSGSLAPASAMNRVVVAMTDASRTIL